MWFPWDVKIFVENSCSQRKTGEDSECNCHTRWWCCCVQVDPRDGMRGIWRARLATWRTRSVNTRPGSNLSTRRMRFWKARWARARSEWLKWRRSLWGRGARSGARTISSSSKKIHLTFYSLKNTFIKWSVYCRLNVLSLSLIFSEYEVELQILSGVRDELEKVMSDKSTLQKELSNLEGKYRVMETLRDSQETELQTLKVKSLDY